MEPKGGFPRMD